MRFFHLFSNGQLLDLFKFSLFLDSESVNIPDYRIQTRNRLNSLEPDVLCAFPESFSAICKLHLQRQYSLKEIDLYYYSLGLTLSIHQLFSKSILQKNPSQTPSVTVIAAEYAGLWHREKMKAY